jgi:hypothetical protein
MALLTSATVARFWTIQDFKKRSSEHSILVEAHDIDHVVKALRDATFQDVERERVEGDRYRMVVRCPPDSLNSVVGLIQRLGGKRYEE